MYIPDDLIKGLVTADGPVLLYFCAGVPTSGFYFVKMSLLPACERYKMRVKKQDLPL